LVLNAKTGNLMSEVQAVAAEAAPAPVTIVEPETPTMENTMSDVWDKLNPQERVDRAPTGEFKSKEAAEAAPAEGAEASDTAKEITQEPTTETVEPEKSPVIDMPASWASDRKGIWDTLSPEARQIVADRESQAQTRLSELGRTVKSIEPIKPHLEQLQRIASQKGIQAQDALQRLIAADEFLDRDPKAAIQWLANAYRLDLSQFAQPQLANDSPESAQFNALTQEINQLKQQLSATTNHITSRERTELQAREQSLTDSVNKFAEGKDYWSDIEPEILNQVHALKLADPARAISDPLAILKEAHDRAIKLTPSVQDKLDKVAKAEAEKKTQADAKKKADEAKRLASLNVRSSQSSPNTKFSSLEEEMTAVYERLNGRG
jgi:hypothetical protein